MKSYEQAGVQLDPKEALLAGFMNGAVEPVVDDAISDLHRGRSPGFLSVVRSDLLIDFAESLQTRETDGSKAANSSGEDDFRAPFFSSLMRRAQEGDPAAISALPKFVADLGQLSAAMELVLEGQEEVTGWREGRPYIQLIGSFNPQHIGHRTTMGAALRAAGERSSLMAQVVANHPVKKDSLPPYEDRYQAGEEHLYTSSLIDPERVTLIDVPVGPGLSKVGAAQIELLADLSGDDRMRWLVGSDKFISDVQTARGGHSEKRAVIRFKEPRMHLYVARRAAHDISEIEDGINFIQEKYGTGITLVDEPPNEMVLASSASRIRQLRAEGKDEEADRLQFTDLQPPAVAAG